MALFWSLIMVNKIKGAVIVTATVLAVIAILNRIPGAQDVVSKALSQDKLF